MMGNSVYQFTVNNVYGEKVSLTDFRGKVLLIVNTASRYPVFEKVHVRGSEVHPLFRFLADKKLNKSVGSVPRWNFHKYLIDRDGHVVDFFYPFTRPVSSRIKNRINSLLSKLQVTA